MTELKNEETKNRELEDALKLDVYVGTEFSQFNDLRNELFEEITFTKGFYKPHRVKETLKTILSNLYIAHCSSMPIRYSRSPNHYSSSRRYGKLHFKYSKVVGIMDALESLGYLHQYKGYFNRKDKVGRQTRVHATEKLIRLFEHIPEDLVEFYPIPPSEIIQLRDEEKKEIHYEETQETLRMRQSLHEYNEFIKDKNVIIKVPGDMPIKVDFLKKLKSRLNKGLIEIVNLSQLMLDSHDRIIVSKDNYSIIHYCNYKYDTDRDKLREIVLDNNRCILYYINTITNKISKYLKKYSKDSHVEPFKNFLNFGVENLEFELKYELLHRVFNRRSFDLGGRFYGAFHLRLPREIRKQNCISINGSRTCELDYSALHIRMLYHHIGIDYREDPYLALCEREEERLIFKYLQLIAINSETEKKAVEGLRDEFRKAGFQFKLTDENILSLLDRFKKAHKPIAHYLNSGIGRTLQNIDSRITEKILMEFMKEGIPVLPVHDSYIIEEKYQGKLAEKMVKFYEQEMGFEPVIG